MLFAFVVQAQKEGLRNLLIVHGKGGKITRTPISCVAIWRAGWSNCPRYRRSARPRHSMAAAERVTSRCANPPRRNRKLGAPRQTQPLAQQQRQLASRFLQLG
jgi:DNA-nicking Smr family endonuclease